MKKLRQILLLIICFLILSSFNALADEYDDYTVKVPLLQTVHMSKDVTSTERIFYNIKNLGIAGDRAVEFGDSSTGNYGDMGPMMTFEIPDTDNLKSAKLKIYAALHSTTKTGYVGTTIGSGTAITLRQYSSADIPIRENTSPDGEALTDYDSEARATYANFYQTMTGYGNTSVVIRSNEILQYGNWNNSETYPMSIDLGSISLAGNSYFTVVIGAPSDTYYSAENTDKLPYIELVYDNEPLREEAAKEAVEALLPYDIENSINGENIDTVEELLADAKQKIERLRDETLKAELTKTVVSVEARKNTFFIEYKRESFTSVDGADIAAELTYELDFAAESDYFIKAEADISDSLGEASAEFRIGDTQILLKSDGVYLNNEKASDITSGKNTFVLRFLGADLRNIELYINGKSVIKKENQDLSNVTEILAHSTDSEKLAIGEITVETCPSGFGEAAMEKVNILKETLNDESKGLKDVSADYGEVITQTDAMSESIFTDMIKTAADDLIKPHLVSERESAENEKNYTRLEIIDTIWEDISSCDLKDSEKALISDVLAEYDAIAPIVKAVSITEISRTEFKATYMIEDSILREEASPIITWLMNGNRVIGIGETIDVSAYVGCSITVSVIPVNNKGTEGVEFVSVPVTVQQQPEADDDFTEKIIVKRRFSRGNDSSGTLNGTIALNRYYTTDGIKNYMFNDGGYYNEGQQFEFDLEDISLESIKGAKLILNAASSNSTLSIKGYTNTTQMPADLGTLSGFSIKDEAVLETLNGIFDNLTEVTLSADNGIESTSTLFNPTEISFDLLKKDDNGNPIITFESGKDLILNVRIPGGDKKGTLVVSDDMLPYIILDVDMEHVRVENAKNAVEAIKSYNSDGAITEENLDTVKELLAEAQKRVSRISDADLKAELLTTVSSVERRMNEAAISASRNELTASDGKNIELVFSETVDFSETDLFIQTKLEIKEAMAENEVVKISADDEITVEIKSTGIYLMGEKVAETVLGEKEILVRNSTEYYEDYVELYIDGTLIAKKEGLILTDADKVTVTNNTGESIVTKSLITEECPKNYGKNAYLLLKKIKEEINAGQEPENVKALYNETNAAIEGMSTSVYTSLISNQFNALIDSYVNTQLTAYISNKKYNEFVSFASFVLNIKNEVLKQRLQEAYQTAEKEFDKLTPDAVYAGIEEVSKTLLKAVYTVKDSVGNAKIADGKYSVILEWLLDGISVIGTDETLDVSSYKGKRIVLQVTPLNNKDVKGEAIQSIQYFVEGKSGSGGSSGGGGGGGSHSDSRSDNIKAEAAYSPIEQITASSDEFNDISSSWAKIEITVLKEKNIVNGDENGNFNPDDKVTRAEFVAMLDRAGKIPSGGEQSEFSDVNNADWFYENVKKASSSGIVTGDNGAFYPNNAITRQEIALILSRITQSDVNFDISNIKDYHNISDWAKDGVSKVYALSVMQGDTDGNFRPLDSVTRAEAAAVIYRIIQ